MQNMLYEFFNTKQPYKSSNLDEAVAYEESTSYAAGVDEIVEKF